MVTIASEQKVGMSQALQDVYGLSQGTATDLVNSGTGMFSSNGELNGDELRFKFGGIARFREMCGSSQRCMAAISTGFFKQIDADLKAAALADRAASSGVIIDSDREVGHFKDLAEKSLQAYFARSQGSRTVEGFPPFRQKSPSASTLLANFKRKYGAKGDVSEVIEFNVDDFYDGFKPGKSGKPGKPGVVKVPLILGGRKNKGLPSTLVAATYVPASTRFPVTPENGYDFLVTKMPEYDDHSDVFINLAKKDATKNSHVMDLNGMAHTGFDAYVYKLKNSNGSFATRFTLVPKSGFSAKGHGMYLGALALEGKLTATPTSEGGIYVSLEMDFDLALVPDALLDGLMGPTIELFVNQLVYAYLASIRQETL